jgi:ABC-type lipoprotein release transport system permease subunit
MTLAKLWVIAYRDLGRNRRRSVLSMLGAALGLGLLIIMYGLVAGTIQSTLANAIRLRTGHVQVRAASYEEDKVSLLAGDLVDRPADWVARAMQVDGVESATPVLWAPAILNTADESLGLQIVGIDPTAPAQSALRDALVSGEFLTADDRGSVVLGRSLADDLAVGVGDKVNLAIVNADGKPDEGDFTVRGLFATGIPSYDESAVLMSLSKAQAFAGVRDRATAIVVRLTDENDAPRVAAALQAPGVATPTWRELNRVFIDGMKSAMGFYVILDGIVMLVVAVIIANTLLMAVFERIREMGILAALGMRRRQIIAMFLIEAAILGLAGVVVGIFLGLIGVAYLVTKGIFIGDMASAAGGLAMGTTMYGRFDPASIVWLSMWTLVIILLASLYPAWFASRLEPVDALHRH